ncbi:MAG: HlyD family efflux transporter periplasmic adaptor subunit [Aureliella sp.]
MRGRLGPDTLTDFAAIPDVTGDSKEQLRKDVEKNLLACHGECKTFLAGPINLNGKPIFLVSVGFDVSHKLDLSGTAVFGVVAHSRPELDLARAEIQTDMQLLLDKLPTSGATSAPAIESTVHPATPADNELDMASRTSRYGSPQEFAFALVNSIARRFQCHQVAFGLRADASVRIQAVSGKDKFKASSPGIVDIQQAMEETLDSGVSVSYQTHGQTSAHNPMPVHQQWAETSRSAVASFPLLVDSDCVAVVSLQRDPNVGFSEAELRELESTLASFGPAVELSVRGNRTLREHVKESAQKTWAQVREPSTKKGRLSRTVALVAAVLFLIGWLPYRPMTPCVVVPSNMTQSLAPFDMQLTEALVRSGDRVQADQPLALFDTKELELERASLISQRDQAEVDVRAALIESDAAKASLAKASAAVFQTQLDAINKKIALCTVRAPSDGMVVNAELDRKIGQVFAQGTDILSFAPMDQFELEIRIPEHNARHIQSQQEGTFVSAADPSHRVDYIIDSVSGSAELIDGKNVFVAKARLLGQSDNFRQGMEGYAKTHTGWAPIPWLAFHRLYEYAKASFWL